MGERTAIAWCDATFNPWWGCQKVSPGCTNCYAEAFDKRLGRDNWRGSHRFFGEAHWSEPLKWNDAAARAQVDVAHPFDVVSRPYRPRVFCASMADVFEQPSDFRLAQRLDQERFKLWDLVRATPHLDWLLLTKRPENAAHMLPWTMRAGIGELVDNGGPWPNVWLGTSVEDQQRADERVPLLLKVPARVRFISCEPLLGPVDLRAWFTDAAFMTLRMPCWVIAGGESGPKARPCDVAWIRSLRDQCKAAGAAFFCKQLGAKPYLKDFDEPDPGAVFTPNGQRVLMGGADDGSPTCAWVGRVRLRDPKGADPSEWPADLRVQEFPA